MWELSPRIFAALLGASLLAPVPLLQQARALQQTPDRTRASGGTPSPGVVDATGRHVGLEAGPFRRVVSLVPSATDLIVALGAAGRLAGRTRYDTAAAVRALPSVGEPLEPSLERIVEIRPDLIIAWPRGRARQLDDLGASVYFARSSSLGDVQRLLRDLGPLLGRPGTADSLRRVLDCQLRQVRRATARRPRRRVAYLVWSDPLFAAGPGSYLDSLIHVAGGRNVFADAPGPWPKVGLESLVYADPEVMLLGSSEPIWDVLRSRSAWRAVEAVESGRVHQVASDIFHRPGPRLGRAASALARLLHPGADIPDPADCAPPPGGPWPRTPDDGASGGSGAYRGPVPDGLFSGEGGEGRARASRRGREGRAEEGDGPRGGRRWAR